MGGIMLKIVLEQRQMLNMVMTTELRQAIELLQLSTYELKQYIQRQAEENPFMELVEKTHHTPAAMSRSSYQKDAANPIDFAASNEKTLYEQLLEQLIDFQLSNREYKLMEYLIFNIDEQGYLKVADEEIKNHAGATNDELARAKEVLHRLEPVGIGAKNLKECLLLQAERKYPGDKLLIQLIEVHLEHLADKKWERISDDLNISLHKVNDLFQIIKTFNPRPASDLMNTKINYVNPDIRIAKEDGKNVFSVSLNDFYLPEIKYNHAYSEKLQGGKELSRYVNSHFKKIEWLRNSIAQRRETILKIMDVIVNRQHAYLEKGLSSALKALTLKEVADEIGMHESTVSRATANKIVETPVGTFELRRLFST